MTTWPTLPLLSVDTESTGVDTATDRIVEVAAVTIAPDGSVTDTWHRIIDPGVEIPDEAAAIHGITTERARLEGVHPAEALSELADRIKTHGGAVVVYNARFDWPLLAAEAERHGIDWPGALILDPLVLDKHIDTYRKGSRRLIDVAAHYGITLDPDAAHGAVADATAAGQTMRALITREPRIASLSLPELQTWQATWSDQQRASFHDYKLRQYPAFQPEPLGWPMPHIEAA